jgi:hypothetical protein
MSLLSEFLISESLLSEMFRRSHSVLDVADFLVTNFVAELLAHVEPFVV